MLPIGKIIILNWDLVDFTANLEASVLLPGYVMKYSYVMGPQKLIF